MCVGYQRLQPNVFILGILRKVSQFAYFNANCNVVFFVWFCIIYMLASYTYII